MGSFLQGVLSFRHSEQRSNAERDSESPALGWDFAPSLTWGRLGWGVSCKGYFLVVILNSGAKRNVIQKTLHWDGILLLPRLGEGWDGECPVRDFFVTPVGGDA